MLVHNINIFAKNAMTPNFESLSTSGRDVVLRLYSGDTIGTSPSIVIFFKDSQEATNFKNAVHQAWETHLREEETKKKL